MKVPTAVGIPTMEMVSLPQDAVTPGGRPVAAPIPVAPVVVWVMARNTEFKHRLGVEEAAVTVMSGVTAILPVALTVPHPPVSGMAYANVPLAVGAPDRVIVLAAQAAVTPSGRPVATPMPVAPVVG